MDRDAALTQFLDHRAARSQATNLNGAAVLREGRRQKPNLLGAATCVEAVYDVQDFHSIPPWQESGVRSQEPGVRNQRLMSKRVAFAV